MSDQIKLYMDDANKAADVLISEALKLKAQRDELLEACIELLEHIHNFTLFEDELHGVLMARAAIAKAKGQS